MTGPPPVGTMLRFSTSSMVAGVDVRVALTAISCVVVPVFCTLTVWVSVLPEYHSPSAAVLNNGIRPDAEHIGGDAFPQSISSSAAYAGWTAARTRSDKPIEVRNLYSVFIVY